MNDVVREPGMIGLLRPKRLEDTARLQLIRVGLVSWWSGRGERDRIEDHRLGVRRLAHHELVHRALVRDHPRSLILVLEVVVQLTDGAYVPALTLRRGGGEPRRGLDCLPSLLKLRDRPISGGHRIAPSTERNAPVCHRAGRIGSEHFIEGADRIRRSAPAQPRDRIAARPLGCRR